LDFAKIMACFDRQRVAFVSVTQQFHTATSMGRLILHVLLSFAQFERELIAERTRDKLAAARRQGRWAGGVLPLGYDVAPRGGRLRVNEEEAVRVRALFAWYLEHQALLPVVRELDRRGWRTKCWRTRQGRQRGGRPFTAVQASFPATHTIGAAFSLNPDGSLDATFGSGGKVAFQVPL